MWADEGIGEQVVEVKQVQVEGGKADADVEMA